MAATIRVGIIGAGWPGLQHTRGYLAAGGFKVVAVADLIPERRRKLMAECAVTREYADAKELIADAEIDAVSICLPNDLHCSIALAAMKSGKHIVCEPPPAINTREARHLEASSKRHGKILLYAFQRRFGGHEQAAKQAIAKGFIGEPYHVRAVWTRTRGVPAGTGWYTQRSRSGGGALNDVGVHMLDTAWHLLGQPNPAAAFGITQARFGPPPNTAYDVEESAFALLRFEGGKSIELAVSWVLNQPPTQNGTVCRVHGTAGAIEVYTPKGAILYHDFTPQGGCRENPLKPPKTTHHVAMMRHFRDCIAGKAAPIPGGAEGVTIMRMIEAIHRSAENERSVDMRR